MYKTNLLTCGHQGSKHSFLVSSKSIKAMSPIRTCSRKAEFFLYKEIYYLFSTTFPACELLSTNYWGQLPTEALNLCMFVFCALLCCALSDQNVLKYQGFSSEKQNEKVHNFYHLQCKWQRMDTGVKGLHIESKWDSICLVGKLTEHGLKVRLSTHWVKIQG